MFEVGDEVVCVDDSPLFCPLTKKSSGLSGLVLGGRYTILKVRSSYGPPLRDIVELVELSHEMAKKPGGVPARGGYRPSRFRKVQKRKTDLSIESFLTIKPDQYEEPRKAPERKKEEVK